MKKTTERKKEIVAHDSMTGINEAWHIALEHKDVYFISPAVYELLHDPESREVILNNVLIVDLRAMIGNDLDQILAA